MTVGSERPMTVTCGLRWGDLDAQGHINNAAFLDFLQEARVDFLIGGAAEHLLGGGVVVVSHSITFRAPVKFSDEPVQIAVWTSQLGAARVALAYRMHHEGVVVAEAETVLCPFDFDHQRPRRLTAIEREWFLDHQAPSPLVEPLPVGNYDDTAHTYDLRVRWSDIDGYGHVNNVCFAEYFQEARVAMTTSAAPAMRRSGTRDSEPSPWDLQDTETSVHQWLVARQDIRYIAQMMHRIESYHVQTVVARLGRTSLTLSARIVDPQDDLRVLATAGTVLVAADAHGQSVELPSSVRSAFTG